MAFELSDDYVDVAARIREFREKYPTGSLQQLDLKFVDFAGKSWVVFTAAAYRTPDDPRPGMGTAWEPVPGKTPYTRDSELQNAETAAWGRAIVATLAADTKKIATAEDVLIRQPTDWDAVLIEADTLDLDGLRALWTRAGLKDAPDDVREAFQVIVGSRQ